MLVAVFHIVCVTLYAFLITNAHIPFLHTTKTTVDFVTSKMIMTPQNVLDYYYFTTSEPGFVRIQLGLLNCCTLHLTVIGSILLVLLGGYGLALFPIEFLNQFLNRPQIVRLADPARR